MTSIVPERKIAQNSAKPFYLLLVIYLYNPIFSSLPILRHPNAWNLNVPYQGWSIMRYINIMQRVQNESFNKELFHDDLKLSKIHVKWILSFRRKFLRKQRKCKYRIEWNPFNEGGSKVRKQNSKNTCEIGGPFLIKESNTEK